MATWLDELNPAQREAVTSGEGPLLVVAGAGTGKTKTLACRVAYLVDQGVDPGRILLLTFTRRAAAEMVGRATHLCASPNIARVWGGTFHSVANRLLRIYGGAADLPADFTVIDQSDAGDMMNLIRSESGVAKGDRRFPRKATLVKIYSHTVNAQRPLTAVLERHFPWCASDREGIASIFEQYVQRKRQYNVLDYDDLLLYWNAMATAPEVGESMANRFEHILVDEYQDTNTLQADILVAMRRKYQNIMVVGDDAQSIYAFRAATIKNILDYPKTFAGARIVTLEQNYRSTQPILAASNAVMAEAKERYTKELWSTRQSDRRPLLWHCQDEADQTETVCSNIIEHLESGISLTRQAVLFRAGHHSADLEVELARRNIPFHKFGGLKFIEAAHIKDVLAILRILENPHDEMSWFRVLQLLEGIGPRTARRIMDALIAPTEKADHEDEPAVVSPLRTLLATPPPVPAAAREGFTSLRAALADCCGRAVNGRGLASTDVAEGPLAPPIAAQIERIERFCEPVFQRVYENANARLRDVEQLSQIAGRYRSRSRFITDLTLDPPSSTSDLAQPPYLEEDYLTLSTIHSAKGCEWTVVHVLHAADGMIPSDMAVDDEDGLEEERRLFYVALTRAKDVLHVYFPLRYYHLRRRRGDDHSYAQLTRFLSEEARELFETRRGIHINEIVDDEERCAGRGGNIRDLDQWLGRLWNS